MFLNFLKKSPSQAEVDAVEAEKQPELILQVIEDKKKLSESMIWQLMEDFYKQGITAWQQTPFHATSNAFIGKAYAELIITFMLEQLPHLNRKEPIYILEMATGTGTFSFYLIKELLAQKAQFESLKDVQFKYIMSDFTQKNVNFWKSNPRLQEFVELGVLDFALFYPEHETKILLQHSRKIITADQVKNPMVAIANYFFDSIRQDLFRIEGGQLFETQVTVQRHAPEEYLNYPVAIDHVELEYTHVPADVNYYSNPKLNEILKSYVEHFTDGSVIFPVAAFQVLENLQALSSNNLMLISTDKGFTQTEFMNGHKEHGYAIHGAFSYMVNYDAIRRYFELHNGLSMGTHDLDYLLTNTVNVMLNNRKPKLEKVQYLFNQNFVTQNLINNLSSAIEILRYVPDQELGAILKTSLATVRMSNYDPGIFWFCGERLCRALPELNYYQMDVLVDILDKVRENYYPLKVGYNALSWVGAIYYEIGQVDKALDTLNQSVAIYGEDVNTGVIYYLALCNETKGNFDAAIQYFQKTLVLDPEAEFVKKDIDRVLQKRKEAQKAAPISA